MFVLIFPNQFFSILNAYLHFCNVVHIRCTNEYAFIIHRRYMMGMKPFFRIWYPKLQNCYFTIQYVRFYQMILSTKQRKSEVEVFLQGVPKKMVIWKGFEFLTLGGVFLGVKNNSKNFGNKKILGCLAKFWVNRHCLSEKCRSFGNFMSIWPCQECKTFLNITKVNFYAYSHINIKNILTFKRIFDILKLKKSYKIKKIWRFWIKQGPFTQNFAKQPNIFFCS